MPPRRAVRRKAGKRGAGAAASSVLARGARGDIEEKHQQHVKYIEDIVQGLKDKVDNKCDCIMNEQALSIDALYRSRDRAKSSIPNQFREMNLEEYCTNYGEDYNVILFNALPPKEREAFLAEAGGDGEEEDDDEDEENNPGTTIKGRPPRVVPQTPSGRGRSAAGRVTRSALKVRPGALTAARPPRAVPSTPSGRGRPPAGRVMRSAIKAKAGGYEAPALTAASEDDLKLPASVVAELRKSANPEHTVYAHLDAIIQSRIDDVPIKAAERCEQLQRKLKEGSAILRATVPAIAAGGAASSVKRARGQANKPSPPVDGVKEEEVMEVMEAEEEEEEEAVVVVGGPARVDISTEGGPYNGCVFKLSLEEEGDPRMIGRSTGKKFKQKGISLSKDSEVSISHGKFENANGKVTFTDVGSTNGTEVDGEPAEQGHAYEIVDGSKLLVGQGMFTVTVTWER